MFRDVYLFSSYEALICTCIDRTNFQTARAVKLFALEVSVCYLWVSGGFVDIFYNYVKI